MHVRPVLLLVWAAHSAQGGVLLVTKRTQSSRDGLADERFFDRYFGRHDNASTYGPGLQRNLAVTLPARIGMHFPTAETSIASVQGGGNLSGWQSHNLRTLGRLNEYNGLLDWATVFYVPELDSHIRQFAVDRVPTMHRSSTLHGVRMYAVIVATPGSGHVLELQSDKCVSCPTQPEFGPTECAAGHRLPRPAGFYREAWRKATQAADGWMHVGPEKLPAPIMVQIKQAVRELEPAWRLWRELVPRMHRRTEGRCTIAAGTVGVGPFADEATGATSLESYPLQVVFVQNAAQQRSVAGYFEFLDRLHEERVGLGWGWDRALDFHVKLIDARHFNRETRLGTSLDHWAALLTAQRIRFAPFNLTQTKLCGGAETSRSKFGGSSMIYTAGPGYLGVELWGRIEHTFFSPDKPIFGWGGGRGSPTSDCRMYLSPADCSFSAEQDPAGSAVLHRARVAANPPSNTAYIRLQCAEGQLVSAVHRATFGSNPGECALGFSAGAECQRDIRALATTLCVGQSACNVPASVSMFGTPCNSSSGWVTAVEATCAPVSDI